VTDTGEIIALDAKMNFNDNALFRHKDVSRTELLGIAQGLRLLTRLSGREAHLGSHELTAAKPGSDPTDRIA
jgi:succinyl-CoA synthetase beta subunit